jgi:hypothetical protein
VEEQNDRLAQFLYLLMRDHVPTGVVATLANRVVHADDEPIIMSAPELGQLAFRYANRIQPVPPDPEAEERERKAPPRSSSPRHRCACSKSWIASRARSG